MKPLYNTVFGAITPQMSLQSCLWSANSIFSGISSVHLNFIHIFRGFSLFRLQCLCIYVNCQFTKTVLINTFFIHNVICLLLLLLLIICFFFSIISKSECFSCFFPIKPFTQYNSGFGCLYFCISGRFYHFHSFKKFCLQNVLIRSIFVQINGFLCSLDWFETLLELLLFVAHLLKNLRFLFEKFLLIKAYELYRSSNVGWCSF